MKHSICMISDFFYPNVGGVESHIFQLSQCLLELGHKVIVMTHHYQKRIGVRFMTNGLKVYYLPVAPFYNQSSFPILLVSVGVVRQVLLREKITIVHGHSAFSSLAIESLFHSKFMDMKAVFTDHSLFGFADTSSILTNKLLECAITNCDHVICVSNTSRENTSLRAKEHPSKISVIPNAVDTSMFLPDPIKAPKDRTVIVVVSRLVYRKGTDLLVGIIPKICARYPDVDFLIAGDGPKMVLIEEVKEQYKLHERVNLVGAQAQDKVRDVLVQGHIFLNTSLTEAFCMAIVEAASCGLQVVSTNVGGIPEVLPESMITLAAPSVNDLVAKLDIVIARHKDQSRMPYNEMHDKVKSFYDWRDVARRTQVVYDNVTKNPQLSFIDNVYQYKKKLSPIAYYIFALYMLMDYLIILLLDFIYPRDKIELAPDVYEFPKMAKTS